MADATPEKPVLPLSSTTPAGAPPLGAHKPPSAGLFGNFSQNTSASLGASGTGLSAASMPPPQTFGSGASTGSLFASKPSAAPTSSLFGGQAAQNASSAQPLSLAASAAASNPYALFGAKPLTSGASSPPSVAPWSIFASERPSTTSAAAAPSVVPNMGAMPQTTEASTTLPTPAPTSLFAKPAAASSTPTTTPSMFGGTGLNTTSSKPAQSSTLFASTSTPNTASNTAPSASMSITPAFGTSAAVANKDAKPSPVAVAVAQSSNTPSTNLGASTSGPASHIQRLKNKSMDDIITRWASDLTKYQKEFKDQATEVARWDSLLVGNGEKIQKLYLKTYEAERASQEVERQLLSVESQQDEMEAWLDRYETEVQEMFSRQMGTFDQLTGPDQERENTYKLAERLTQHLEEKTRNLSQMVQEINELSGTLGKGNKTEDPLSQIVRVLNGHLAQLQWIDANSLALHAKVAAAQKASGSVSSNNYGASDDASESFYRSYMGRG